MNGKQTIDALREFMRKNGFPENKEPFRINLAGIRTSYNVTNKFDDTLCAWRYTENGSLEYIIGDGTTKAGLFYTSVELLNPEGVAIISEGYHKDLWTWGHHHEYEAFKQFSPFKGYRDKNKNLTFDLNELIEIKQTACVNMHHSGSDSSDDKNVGRNSAGCQVWEQMADWIRLTVWGKKDNSIYSKPFSYLCVSRDAINETWQNMQLSESITPPTLSTQAPKIEAQPQGEIKEIVAPIQTGQTAQAAQTIQVQPKLKHLSIVELIMKLLQTFFKKK